MTRQEAEKFLDEALDSLDGDADSVLVIARRGDQITWGNGCVQGENWKELARKALDHPDIGGMYP
jgi:hypothetical protein